MKKTKKKGYVLGLNGWFNRSHDASACVVADGKILAMAEEERFIRKKHAYDKTPLYSTLWCLSKLGLTLDDIDEVAIGWDYRKRHSLASVREPKLDNLIDVFFPKSYFMFIKKPKIKFVSHHLAHAASAFFLSGFKNSSILIVDGQGEDASVTFAVGKGNEIEVLWNLPVANSLGYFYEAISDYIGLGLDSAGKTMGLAPYGNFNEHVFYQFALNQKGFDVTIRVPNIIGNLDQQQALVSAWEKEFETIFEVKKNKTDFKYRNLCGDLSQNMILNQNYKDIAASAQFTLEQVMKHCIRVLVNKTGIKNICLSGGVALNCSVNTKIYKMQIVEKLFIPPFANDGGASVGAALYVGGIKSKEQLKSVYLGPSFTNKEVGILLKNLKIKYTYHRNIEEKVAQLLHKGYIVSWFQGKMEVGPRALGNRSIIANPTLENTHRKVNQAKNREQWRPLAPSILEEKGDLYLENYFPSPFMLHTFNVRQEMRKKVPAIVHVDGSTRVQTVNKKANPKYYKLIESFEKLSGIPIVLNTSFNGAKEPIVCSPLDAISSFYSNSTDYLAIGKFLLKK